jgi:hypothetical protein
MTKFNCCFGLAMVYYDYSVLMLALGWTLHSRT